MAPSKVAPMIFARIINKLANKVATMARKTVIREYVEFCDTKPQKQALLSYLVLPLLPPRRLRDRTMFSNRGIAQVIPQVLNELGYSVDVVNYDNDSWRPTKDYDLFIGHGGINFENISRTLSPRITRIYFATGLYWKEWNRRLTQRICHQVERRGCVTDYRAIQYDEDYATSVADGIICL